MAGFFFDLGRSLRSGLRKGQWVFDSVTGSEADALRAEYEAGRDLAQALLGEMRLDNHPEVVRFLEQVGARLADRVRNKQRRFSFRSLWTSERNAFALPGGFIFATRPLLELCGWDVDEVAFILAHEMAHVLHGHAMERITNGWVLAAAGRAVRLSWAGSLLLQQATEMVHKAYSRDQELDADLLGVQLSQSAGFDPHGGKRLLCRLQANAVPDSPLDVYFATHPSFPDRIANVNQYLESAGR
jgi:beta-barrel assembly-enhancing protease